MAAAFSSTLATAASPAPAVQAISSDNATRHGGTSKKLFVPGEDPAAFEALLAGLFDEYRPDTFQSVGFVRNLAEAHWFLARRQRAHAAIEAAIYSEQPDEAQWTEAHLKRIALADRYRTQAERALKRALNNIESWRKWNRAEADRDLRSARWEAEHSLKERRVALAEEKFRSAQAEHKPEAPRFAKNAVSSPLQQTASPETRSFGSSQQAVDAHGSASTRTRT